MPPSRNPCQMASTDCHQTQDTPDLIHVPVNMASQNVSQLSRLELQVKKTMQTLTVSVNVTRCHFFPCGSIQWHTSAFVSNFTWLLLSPGKKKTLWVIGKKIQPLLPMPPASTSDIIGHHNKIGVIILGVIHLWVQHVGFYSLMTKMQETFLREKNCSWKLALLNSSILEINRFYDQSSCSMQ